LRHRTEECGTPLSGLPVLAGEVPCPTPKCNGTPKVSARFVCLREGGMKKKASQGFRMQCPRRGLDWKQPIGWLNIPY